MSGYLLDTSALLALRDNEPGADRVAAILSASSVSSPVYACFMSLMELFYRVWKDEGKAAGHAAYKQCQTLPIIWIHETPSLLERAASIKATQALSLADAWIAAAAIECNATLVHKDPEFEPLPKLKQEHLPYK